MPSIAVIEALDITPTDYVISFTIREGADILLQDTVKVPRSTVAPAIVDAVQKAISNAAQRLILNDLILPFLQTTQWSTEATPGFQPTSTMPAPDVPAAELEIRTGIPITQLPPQPREPREPAAEL